MNTAQNLINKAETQDSALLKGLARIALDSVEKQQIREGKLHASLMTFNIAHGRGLSLYQGFHTSRGIQKNLDRIAGIIRRHQPDVVALQEVDECSHWNRHINLLDYLQEATRYPFSEHGVHNKREGRKRLSYGNAFLSKFPIIQSEVVAFGGKKLGEKGYMEIQVDFNGTLIDFINLHLDFRSRKVRMQQIDRLLQKIERRHYEAAEHLPPIICGDFNTDSRVFRDAVRQFVVRSAEQYHYSYFPKNGRTFPAHLPSRGLDFILLAKPYQETNTEIIRSYASDHLPAIIRFALPIGSFVNGRAKTVRL